MEGTLAPTRLRRTAVRAAAAVLLAGTALLGSAGLGPASAQRSSADTGAVRDRPAEDGPHVLVEAGASLMAPLVNLSASDAGDGAGDPEPAPSLSVAPSVSANAVYLLGPMLGVGLHGTWARPDVDLERVVGGTPEDGDRRLGHADFLAATGELVYRPLAAPGAPSIDPFLAAGAGLRHLSFSEPSLEGGTDPLGTVAGGVRTDVGGRFFWTLEVRGLFAPADPTGEGSRIQSDVLVTVGVGLGL